MSTTTSVEREALILAEHAKRVAAQPPKKPRQRHVVKIIVTPTTPQNGFPQLLTIKQAANYTQQCEGTIRESIKRGLLRTKRLSRKTILIPREEFLTQQQPEVVVL